MAGKINLQNAHQSTCRLMGIVNVTPDSFSDGGEHFNIDAAVAHGLLLVEEGADILDIGGESTRPGAHEVSVEEELARVLPAIEQLAGQTDIAISIDTRKPEVAIAAIEAGATIWNDVSALTFSPDSLGVAARLDCDLVLMHAQGTPTTMQQNPHYQNVVPEVIEWLHGRVKACELAGIAVSRLIVDPGIGFGKTLDHNLKLIAELETFLELGLPILFGASRKRFIEMLDRPGPAAERLGGSIAVALLAAQKGASIIRVHDVAETRQALAVWNGVKEILL